MDYTPLPEEYSRVTNPERFRPLVEFVARYLDELAVTYDVVVTSEFRIDADAGMQAFSYARPPVRLTPVNPLAAPVAVAFSEFPSVVVRCGFWYTGSFPSCGCDACDETAEREIERFREMIDAVVAGRFSEKLILPFIGRARVQHSVTPVNVEYMSQLMGNYASGSFGEQRVSRRQARQLLGHRCAVPQWVAWPRRTVETSTSARDLP